MDRFELNWPNTDAQLLTDGRRCRIVWRQRDRHQRGGMGGTIDNNLQCVRRLAESLDGSPDLLGALRSRGHDRLARQIETVAGSEAAPPVVTPPVRRPEGREPARAPAVPPTTMWLNALDGSDAWESATGQRSKTWVEIGRLGEEALLLKAPAPKGKPEWAIKRTWPDLPKRKAEYVTAGDFRGLARWLRDAGADADFIERMLGAASVLDDEALAAAAVAWRRVRAKITH